MVKEQPQGATIRVHEMCMDRVKEPGIQASSAVNLICSDGEAPLSQLYWSWITPCDLQSWKLLHRAKSALNSFFQNGLHDVGLPSGDIAVIYFP